MFLNIQISNVYSFDTNIKTVLSKYSIQELLKRSVVLIFYTTNQIHFLEIQFRRMRFLYIETKNGFNKTV